MDDNSCVSKRRSLVSQHCSQDSLTKKYEFIYYSKNMDGVFALCQFVSVNENSKFEATGNSSRISSVC